jgi:hypothetical protein
MVPKDEGIASDGRAGPNMRRLVAPCTSAREVGHQNLMVDLRSARARSEVPHRIQIGNVNTLGLALYGAGIGRINFVVSVVLLHIHTKDANVYTINSLKER